MKPPVVIGMNPSAALKPKKNATMAKLYSWMDTVGFKYFSFANAVPTPGEVKHSMVDNDELKSYTETQPVIALGGFSSSALSRAGIDHFKLPHPSPRNRLLNDKTYEQQCLKDCEQYLREHQ